MAKGIRVGRARTVGEKLAVYRAWLSVVRAMRERARKEQGRGRWIRRHRADVQESPRRTARVERRDRDVSSEVWIGSAHAGEGNRTEVVR